MHVSDLLRREIAARFAAADAPGVLVRLTETPLPFLDAPDRARDRDRVHLAILRVADGNLQRFEAALALAARDWRDLLVGAGLAHGNWPDVLRAAGYPVP